MRGPIGFIHDLVPVVTLCGCAPATVEPTEEAAAVPIRPDGRELADLWCSKRHRVATDQPTGARPGHVLLPPMFAPTFAAVANRHGVDADHLDTFLTEQHLPMPTYRLTAEERLAVRNDMLPCGIGSARKGQGLHLRATVPDAGSNWQPWRDRGGGVHVLGIGRTTGLVAGTSMKFGVFGATSGKAMAFRRLGATKQRMAWILVRTATRARLRRCFGCGAPTEQPR